MEKEKGKEENCTYFKFSELYDKLNKENTGLTPLKQVQYNFTTIRNANKGRKLNQIAKIYVIDSENRTQIHLGSAKIVEIMRARIYYLKKELIEADISPHIFETHEKFAQEFGTFYPSKKFNKSSYVYVFFLRWITQQIEKI